MAHLSFIASGQLSVVCVRACALRLCMCVCDGYAWVMCKDDESTHDKDENDYEDDNDEICLFSWTYFIVTVYLHYIYTILMKYEMDTVFSHVCLLWRTRTSHIYLFTQCSSAFKLRLFAEFMRRCRTIELATSRRYNTQVSRTPHQV